MNKKEKKGVSIREYARLLGVSDTAVLKAYKAGKISKKGIVYPEDGSRPYVVIDIANADWNKSINLDAGNNLHLAQSLGEKTKPEVKNKPKNTVNSHNSEEHDTEITFDDKETYNEAKRKEAVLKAKLLKLQLQEKEGELIDKRAVEKQLAEMGIKFRETIEAIPNQTIDTLLSSNRNEALVYFQNFINETLTKLSNVSL